MKNCYNLVYFFVTSCNHNVYVMGDVVNREMLSNRQHLPIDNISHNIYTGMNYYYRWKRQ